MGQKLRTSLKGSDGQMSAMWGADADELDQLGGIFENAGSTLSTISSNMSALLSQASWIGSDAEEFHSDWTGRSAVALQTVAQRLHDAATVLHQNATQQRQASEADSSGSVGAGLAGQASGPSGSLTASGGSAPTDVASWRSELASGFNIMGVPMSAVGLAAIIGAEYNLWRTPAKVAASIVQEATNAVDEASYSRNAEIAASIFANQAKSDVQDGLGMNGLLESTGMSAEAASRLGTGMGALGIIGDGVTIWNPDGTATTTQRVVSGVNMAATGAAMTSGLIATDAALAPVPVVGEVVALGTGLFLTGDYLDHAAWFRAGASDTFHAVGRFGDYVGSEVETGVDNVGSGVETGADDVGSGVETGADDVGSGVETGVDDVGSGATHAAESVWHEL
jgi:uncharacterized protein YukE